MKQKIIFITFIVFIIFLSGCINITKTTTIIYSKSFNITISENFYEDCLKLNGKHTKYTYSEKCNFFNKNEINLITDFCEVYKGTISYLMENKKFRIITCKR